MEMSARPMSVQQVMAVEKQQAVYGDDFIIRDLFIPPAGRYWLTADAKQIEYRLFAHYARSPKIIAAYRENPDLSFHKHVHELLRVYKPDLQYKALKNLNFAKIYGAGLIKLAAMMEFITETEGDAIRQRCQLDHMPYRKHPALATVLEIDAIYRRELPEVQPLLDAASKMAEQRGYVKTILGRRMRFPEKSRLHKALNGVIQGSAADIMKLKLVELHRERAYTGLTLRFTVHDEVDGDVPDEEAAARVEEVLNRPLDLDLRVPILWDVQCGLSWGRAAPLSKRVAQYGGTVDDDSRGGRDGA
jgi:DNA polymerase-1